jgi:glycerophosphoryl diester phosphodiesterase
MMKDDWTWRYPRHVAHRGGGTLAPENTLAAMRVGQGHGYKMAECDAKLSGDGTLVLMHDATVERTTNGKGRVAGMTWGELARLDAGHAQAAERPQFIGEPVPTLEAVVRHCLANGFGLNVEIKPCPGRERETGAAVAVELKRIWHGDGLPPLISSFSEVALEAARQFAPHLPRALLQDKLTADWSERLARLDCVALDANFRELTREVVAQARGLGYRVVSYTPNDPVVAAALLDWGVDCVITDAIDRIRPDA